MAHSPFVLKRLRAKPVTYTVEISHLAVGGEWQMSVTVRDLVEDDEQSRRVASDLRLAADILDGKAGE